MMRRESKVLTTQEELDHVPGGTHSAVRWHADAGPASGRGHDHLRGHTLGCERPGPEHQCGLDLACQTAGALTPCYLPNLRDPLDHCASCRNMAKTSVTPVRK